MPEYMKRPNDGTGKNANPCGLLKPQSPFTALLISGINSFDWSKIQWFNLYHSK